jgi:TetR/AcrR family transcriptional repressor of mexJK operon
LTGVPHSRGRPRMAELDVRRSTLLAVATRLFQQHGYHGVSLAAIAREAHVALRTIYLGFGDKAGLFGAVQAESLAAFTTHYALLDPARELQASLRAFGLAYIAFLAGHQALHADAAPAPGLVRPAHAALEMTWTRLTAYFDAPAVREQLRRDLDSALAASHFIACISGDLRWRGGAAVPARVDLFLRAVVREAAPEN